MTITRFWGIIRNMTTTIEKTQTVEQEPEREKINRILENMVEFTHWYIPKDEKAEETPNSSIFSDGIGISLEMDSTNADYKKSLITLQKTHQSRQKKINETEIRKQWYSGQIDGCEIEENADNYINARFGTPIDEDGSVSIDKNGKSYPAVYIGKSQIFTDTDGKESVYTGKNGFDRMEAWICDLCPEFGDLNHLAKREIMAKLTNLNGTTLLVGFNSPDLDKKIQLEVRSLMTTYIDSTTKGLNRNFGEELIRTEFEKIAKEVRVILDRPKDSNKTEEEANKEKYEDIMKILNDIWFVIADLAGLHGFNEVGGQGKGDQYIKMVLGHFLALIRLGGDETGFFYRLSKLKDEIFSMVKIYNPTLDQEDDIEAMTWDDYFNIIISSFDSTEILDVSEAPALIEMIANNLENVEGNPFKEFGELVEEKITKYLPKAIAKLKQNQEDEPTERSKKLGIRVKAKELRLKRINDAREVTKILKQMVYTDPEIMAWVSKEFGKTNIGAFFSDTNFCLGDMIADGKFNTQKARGSLLETITTTDEAKKMKEKGVIEKDRWFNSARQVLKEFFLKNLVLNNRSIEANNLRKRLKLEKRVQREVELSNMSTIFQNSLRKLTSLLSVNKSANKTEK